MTGFKRLPRIAAVSILIAMYTVALGAPLVTANSYETQLREEPDARPSLNMPLGTDDLGRDRWARFAYGSRVSLLLAPVAALVSTCAAAFLGVALPFLPRHVESAMLMFLDLFLALPSVFVLIIARSLLPLNISPEVSLAVTFALVSALGWPSAARALRAATLSLKQTDFVFQALAYGCSPLRLLVVQLLPNLRAVVVSKFLISVPAFVIAEATLGMLGLGISEPMPSWGTQLFELASYRNIPRQPWILVPAIALVAFVWSFQQLVESERTT